MESVKNTQVNFRTNAETLEKVKKIFEIQNLDLTKAINLFFERTLEENGVPFDVYQDQQAERIFQELKSEIQKGYDSYRLGEKISIEEMRSHFGV